MKTEHYAVTVKLEDMSDEHFIERLLAPALANLGQTIGWKMRATLHYNEDGYRVVTLDALRVIDV